MEAIAGRDACVAEVCDYLGRGHNVLLVGPPGIGKSAIIAALPAAATRNVFTIDPFERVTPRQAAAIRRAMDLRDQQYLVATRSLDRHHLGAVRRIAWRFTTLRVPPLSTRVLQRLIAEAVLRHAPPGNECFLEMQGGFWLRDAARLAAGRPGVALAIAEAAARMRGRSKAWPSPPAAYVEARMSQAGFDCVPGRPGEPSPGREPRDVQTR